MQRIASTIMTLTLGLLGCSAAASVSIPALDMPLAAGTSSGNGIVLRGAMSHSSPIRSSATLGADTLTLRSGMLGIAVARYAPECPGDINDDGLTNSIDFNILASNYGATVPPYTSGDLTGDGVVNSGDFNILAGSFGCGTSSLPPA